MKRILVLVLTMFILSCNQSLETSNVKEIETDEASSDTTMVKIENKLSSYNDIVSYSKSFTYCWVTNNDTLDFEIRVTQSLRDSSVSINLVHQNPMLFTEVLNKTNSCIPLIEEDFSLKDFKYFSFNVPLFYLDMATKLSNKYLEQFGTKNIRYTEFTKFLKQSWLQEKLDDFLNQINKRADGYGLEKFHILEKKNYSKYIPNTDLDDYPSHTVHGYTGLSVRIISN